ncbi:hypothetical protein GCM10009663_19280 [Kitasatospora arboriphila]|uniref:Uncharacterized protein n=1 Tax=Kitasatospora arboriphila TaxID=258052 RepID=A0ABP4E182_9ACTN
MAENWPEIVRAGAEAFGNVEHMVLLNGAEGMGEMMAKALTMGGTGLGLARQLLAAMGQQQAPAEPVAAAGRAVSHAIPVQEGAEG